MCVSQILLYFRHDFILMKKTIIIIFLFISVAVNATKYYVKNSGSDSHTGLSDAQAWQTISKVNGASLVAGDTILFNRGNTWREQIVPHSGSVGTANGIYCMGDSQTSADYPPLLQTSLGSTYTVIDRGVGGNTTTDMIARFATDITNYSNVDYVIIMAGTNDILNNTPVTTIEANLQIMYNLAHAKGAKVIALTITPMGGSSLYNPTHGADVILVNTWIKTKPTNVDYVVDTYTAMLDPDNPVPSLRSGDTIDGLHYSATGNQRILATMVAAWQPSLRHTNNVYYGAYGTGAKPKFLGSVTANSGWTNISGNIWQNSNAAFTVDVGNIIFNNEASCGIKLMTATPTFTTQGQFWYDFVNHRIRMYSVGDPASFYSNIECALKADGISHYQVDYVTFQNLDFRYWGMCVRQDGGNYANYLDLDISYIGGCDQSSDYTTRFGNGLQIWEGRHDITIERCRIDNVYDAGISPQGYAGGYVAYNMYIRNNIISNCEYSFEFYERDATASAYNIYFENNTCVNAGGGWAHNQRPDGVNGSQIRLVMFTATKSTIYIRNNIFSNATERLFLIGSTSDLINMVLDYNDCYQSSGIIGQISSVNYSILSTWQTAISQESHSIGTNPLFVSTSDFHLQANSPAIDVGEDVGLPFSGKAPDLGAFEMQTSSTTVNQPPVVEISNPLKGNNYETNSTITLEAIASDPDGSISKVEFYNGAIKLIELTSAPYTYTWKDVAAGNYSITAVATDNLNATTTSLPLEFEVGTTIKYDANSDIIKLYPNPNDGHFSIEFINPLQNEKSEILITDLAGKMVYSGPVSKEETIKQIDLSNSKPGIYIMMIKDKEILVTKKIIIK
jgi:lysophospholipase L1-like esterase